MKKIAAIPLVETGFLTNLITDYLTQKLEVKDFYGNFPNLDGFQHQLKHRKKFDSQKRAELVKLLQSQNKFLALSEITKNNIRQLNNENTFTVTTGHQLNLFSGPLYVIYKLLTTINLADELKNKFPENHFVPIYWMATEDHDFEEINHFWVHQQKLQWHKKSGGAVGQFNTDGLDEVFNQFKNLLIDNPNSEPILHLFEQSYLKHTNLADANRYLINELFGKFGLVIIDGDDAGLKNQFKTFLVDELINHTCEKSVILANTELEKKYKIQVNLRAINLFYLKDGIRERIFFEEDNYKILNTNFTFSKEEMLQEVEQYPERFSPNVLMRPLYQEVVLPNLCYIGGAGELAYWLQLKFYFETQKVDFPILLHRNSALILTEKQQQKIQKLGLNQQEILWPLTDLINQKIKEIAAHEIDFSKERTQLELLFKQLEAIATKTDKSFIGAVKAQHQKQINGLNKLEKRLIKAEKRKHQAYINQLTNLHIELFPNGILQERTKNFTDLLLLNKDAISALKHQFNPFDFSIDIFQLP
ncbi:MAG: bacillithiol biosynthesis cysteine-adding enzyme BshC [Flavobacteriaceae bacterium]|nr:bacillithiol biosynthesis cysteine-adding enzyme BshC [Flavobacteriaceae bacterium]